MKRTITESADEGLIRRRHDNAVRDRDGAGPSPEAWHPMQRSQKKTSPKQAPDTRPLETWVRETALELGFDQAAITHADAIGHTAEGLRAFLAAGHHGDMGWMEDRELQRASPKGLWPDCRSVIAVALNYGPDYDPRNDVLEKQNGVISVYARHRDYHDLVKKKLKALARAFVEKTGSEVKVFVDTAPVMEKPLAEAAGLGFQGKHTNLVSRALGSWIFLGIMYTAHELEPDAAETNHCGRCRACLDACPTNAFPAPFQIDARRCISYLTIETKDVIPRAMRKAIGNRIYGCDACLSVCPWNKFAETAREARLVARDDLKAPNLRALLGFDDAAFRLYFSGSPIKRIGRHRFTRNVLIAIGNSGDPAFIPDLVAFQGDESPLVRGAAVWAAQQLMGADTYQAFAREHAPRETDPLVLEEWRAGPPVL